MKNSKINFNRIKKKSLILLYQLLQDQYDLVKKIKFSKLYKLIIGINKNTLIDDTIFNTFPFNVTLISIIIKLYT